MAVHGGIMLRPRGMMASSKGIITSPPGIMAVPVGIRVVPQERMPVRKAGMCFYCLIIDNAVFQCYY